MINDFEAMHRFFTLFFKDYFENLNARGEKEAQSVLELAEKLKNKSITRKEVKNFNQLVVKQLNGQA